MFTHVLVRADDTAQLHKKLGLSEHDTKVFEHKVFGSRQDALEYLQHHMQLLDKHLAIAVGVTLPDTLDYVREIEKLTKLGNKLKRIPPTWRKSRGNLERKILAQQATLRHIERTQASSGKLHWVVYSRNRDTNAEQPSRYCPPVQSSRTK